MKDLWHKRLRDHETFDKITALLVRPGDLVLVMRPEVKA